MKNKLTSCAPVRRLLDLWYFVTLLDVIPALVKALDSVGCELGWLLIKSGRPGRVDGENVPRHGGDIQAVSVAITYVSTNLTLKWEKKFTGAERFCFLRNVM